MKLGLVDIGISIDVLHQIKERGFRFLFYQ